jgi:hypothetical protein
MFLWDVHIHHKTTRCHNPDHKTTIWGLSLSSLTIKCGIHIWLTWTDPCRSAGVRLPNWFPCCLGMSGQAGTPFPATCMHSTSQTCHIHISTQNISASPHKEKKQAFNFNAIIMSLGFLPIYHSDKEATCETLFSLTLASYLLTSKDVI